MTDYNPPRSTRRKDMMPFPSPRNMKAIIAYYNPSKYFCEQKKVRKGWNMKYKALLSAMMITVLLIACIGTAFAVSGTNASVETFHVHANNGNAYIKLKSTKGVACGKAFYLGHESHHGIRGRKHARLLLCKGRRPGKK